MDLGGASSSEEDEDLPIGVATTAAAASASASSSAAAASVPSSAPSSRNGAATVDNTDAKESDIESGAKKTSGPDGDGAALAAAIAAAGATSVPSQDIDYVALAADNPELAEAERAVLQNPYDANAWQSICGLAQNLPLDRARPLYERFLRRFPTAGRFWKYYADHEYRNGDVKRAETVLERGLLSTVSCELWRFYVKFKQGVLIGSAPGGDPSADDLPHAPTTEAYDAVEAAFGRALDEIGGSVDAVPLWQSFIDFFSKRLEAAETQFDQGSLQNKLRSVYQRAIKQPIEGILNIWKAYEEFERSLVSEGNRILAERILKDKEPGALNTIELARERAKLYVGINLSLLACPAGKRISGTVATQLKQLRKWRDVVKWEKEQSATQSASEIRIRVRHTYKQALCCLRFFPELWYEFAMEELAARDTEAALQVLSTASSVLAPNAGNSKELDNADNNGSLLLYFARASLLERLNRLVDATNIYKELSEIASCPLVHIQYMRFARRALKNGVKAARSVFAKARKRKDNSCSWRVFVCSALIEFYANKNPDVAGKVFELGLKRFPDCVPFILQYIKFLSGLNGQEATLRVLFQRIVGSALNDDSPDKIKPVWIQYLAFENSMTVDGGDIGASEMLEKRFRDKYTELGAKFGGAPTGLALQAYRHSFLDLEPDFPADRAYLEREGYARHGMMSGPLTFMPGASVGTSLASADAASSSSADSGRRSGSQARSQSSISRSRSKRSSRSRSVARGGSQPSGPMVIYPSFLAPILAELPLDDVNVYWPTKEEDVRNTIRRFQTLPLPPAPPPPADDDPKSEVSTGKRKRGDNGDDSTASDDAVKAGKGKKRAAGNDIYLRRKRERAVR